MRIKRFSFLQIDASMYVVITDSQAVIIDPCANEDAYDLILSAGISRVVILLTHEHYDHISGVNWWKERIDCTVICTSKCGENIQSSKKNASRHFDSLFLFMSEDAQEEVRKLDFKEYSCCADYTFETEYRFEVEGHRFQLTATPGHSLGSCCILLDDKYCFTGDTLLENIPTLTRLPGGNKAQYIKSQDLYLKKLQPDTIICPGHGDMFRLGAERFKQE